MRQGGRGEVATAAAPGSRRCRGCQQKSLPYRATNQEPLRIIRDLCHATCVSNTAAKGGHQYQNHHHDKQRNNISIIIRIGICFDKALMDILHILIPITIITRVYHNRGSADQNRTEQE